MRYIIHNKDLIQPQSQQKIFEQEVQKAVKTLEEVAKSYTKELLLDVFVKKDKKNRYKISVSVHLKSKWLIVEEEGYDAMLAVNVSLDKLRKRIREQLSLERREYIYKRKNRQDETVREHIPTLAAYKKENEQELFVHLLSNNLPSVRNYIKRRLKMAEATSINKNSIFSLDDIVSEVYIRAFDLFESKPEVTEKILPWIYQLADEVLKEQLQEREFEKEHMEDLQTIAKKEILDMSEDFSVDADGDLVMMEELDDPSYYSKYYEAAEILKSNADEKILQEIEKSDERKIHQIISQALAGQQSLKRSIFDLFWLEGFGEEEIAHIKNMTVEEVRSILKEIQNSILTVLRKQTIVAKEE